MIKFVTYFLKLKLFKTAAKTVLKRNHLLKAKNGKKTELM